MKKLLLFATIMTAIAFKAQETPNETKQLEDLISIAKSNPDQKATAVVQIMVLGAKSKDDEIKKSADSVVAVLNDYALIDKLTEKNGVVSSRPISDLSKEDLKMFRLNDDKFKEMTFIHHKREGGILYNYLSLKNGFVNMRLVASYSGKDWVFFDKIIILADGSKYEIPFDGTDRTIGSGYVYEVGDLYATPEIIEIFRKIASSALVEVRFSGKNVHDEKLGKYPFQVIKETLALYDKLKK